MSSSNLVRLSGLAAVLGSVLFLVAELLSFATETAHSTENLSEWATTTPWLFTWALFLLGGVLLLIGLVGLYVRQSEAAGIYGLLGFVAAFLGTALAVGAIGFSQSFFVGFPLGWGLFGATTLTARVYPRAAAIVLVVGAFLAYLPVPLSGRVLDAAVAWLGFILFTGRGETAPQPSRVS